MATVFHARPYGRLVEIKINLRRKKLPRTNQNYNFRRGRFSNRDNIRFPIQSRRERSPNILIDIFLQEQIHPLLHCINGLLPKIAKICFIAKQSHASIIGISES